MRINATRSKDLHSRSKMLREAEDAMRRWGCGAGTFFSGRRLLGGHGMASPAARVWAPALCSALPPTAHLTHLICHAAGPPRCLELDPTDGRPYVSLGKVLVMQRRYDEASKLYEEGAAATGAQQECPAGSVCSALFDARLW